MTNELIYDRMNTLYYNSLLLKADIVLYFPPKNCSNFPIFIGAISFSYILSVIFLKS